MKDLVLDLFCGSGGWTDGFMAEGFEVVGVDLEHHPLYRGQLILQDVRDLDGARLSRFQIIVASPPCTAFTRASLPWLPDEEPDMELIKTAFRIGGEAKPKAFILENVRAAQRWLGPATTHRGAFYLWGDVPELPKMRLPRKQDSPGQRPDLRARIPTTLARAVANGLRESLL